MALPPKRSHKISLEKAAAMTQRHRGNAFRGGMFFREELDAMLAQPGCAGVRLYLARGDDGKDTMVMTGVDADGEDMTSGILMQEIIPCPPRCNETSALN